MTSACGYDCPPGGSVQLPCANTSPSKLTCSTIWPLARSPETSSSVSSRGATTTVSSGDSPGSGQYVSVPEGRSRYHEPGLPSASRTFSARNRLPLGNEHQAVSPRVWPASVSSASPAASGAAASPPATFASGPSEPIGIRDIVQR